MSMTTLSSASAVEATLPNTTIQISKMNDSDFERMTRVEMVGLLRLADAERLKGGCGYQQKKKEEQ